MGGGGVRRTGGRGEIGRTITDVRHRIIYLNGFNVVAVVMSILRPWRRDITDRGRERELHGPTSRTNQTGKRPAHNHRHIGMIPGPNINTRQANKATSQMESSHFSPPDIVVHVFKQSK